VVLIKKKHIQPSVARAGGS